MNLTLRRHFQHLLEQVDESLKCLSFISSQCRACAMNDAKHHSLKVLCYQSTKSRSITGNDATVSAHRMHDLEATIQAFPV